MVILPVLDTLPKAIISGVTRVSERVQAISHALQHGLNGFKVFVSTVLCILCDYKRIIPNYQSYCLPIFVSTAQL